MTGAGLAVGAAVPITVSAIQDDPVKPATETEMRPMRVGPVVLHLRDPDSGRFDLFVGTNQFPFTDQALVARLSQVATES